MPSNAQKQENSTGKQMQALFRKSVRKAPGTRIGTLIDWRDGSARSGKKSGRYGHAFRDGR